MTRIVGRITLCGIQADIAKDIAGNLLQVSVSLAGLLLVFVGFVYTRSDTFTSEVRADRYRDLARAGLVPLGLALVCAWLSLDVMEGAVGSYRIAAVLFRGSLIATGGYGVIALFKFL